VSDEQGAIEPIVYTMYCVNTLYCHALHKLEIFNVPTRVFVVSSEFI
jgi:hypothetical protein